MKKGLTAYLIILASMLTGFLLWNMKPIMLLAVKIFKILLPFIYGGIFAYLLKPLNRYIKKQFANEKLGKGIAVFTCVIVLLGTFIILAALIIPGFVESVMQLISQSSNYLTKIDQMFHSQELSDFAAFLYEAVSKWINENLLPYVENITVSDLGFMGNVFAAMTALFTVAKNMLIGVVVMVYLLLDGQIMGKHFMIVVRALFQQKTDKMIEIVKMVDKAFSSFIRGKLWDSLIIGVLCFVLTSLLKIPYALLVSVIVGITNIIPFFGPFIGAVPSAFIILVNSPTKAIIFVVIIILLQQFDGNLLGPMILGDSTGLSPFWVLFSIILCGGLFGVVGMIIGVPLFSVLSTLISQWLERKENKPEVN